MSLETVTEYRDLLLQNVLKRQEQRWYSHPQNVSSEQARVQWIWKIKKELKNLPKNMVLRILLWFLERLKVKQPDWRQKR